MTDTTPAETLAAAATRVRRPYSAEHPALVAPALQDPAGDLLDAAAELAHAYPALAGNHDQAECDDYACGLMGTAVTLARAILTATPGPHGPAEAAVRPQERPAPPPQGHESRTGLSEAQAGVQPFGDRLRARLVAERYKAARNAAAPRPKDREHLALVHGGIRAGLDIALRLLDNPADDNHTCPDGQPCPPHDPPAALGIDCIPAWATGGERHDPNCPTVTPDAVLRERIAGILTAAGGRYTGTDADHLADAVMAVRDRYLEQTAAGRATWKAKAEEIGGDRDQWRRRADRAEAALGRARAAHPRWGEYCAVCTVRDGVLRALWPCDTIRALDGTDTPKETAP